MRNGVSRCEERAVQPSPPLQDELGQGIGDIGLADRSLDVS